MTPAADRVVIVVFDGLRPDMVAGRMPRLAAFAEEGVWFTEARSVFPSYTRVATTATATGCHPARHGVVNNAFHAPALLQGRPLDTSQPDDIALLERAPGGSVHARAMGERLAAAGKTMGAVHCGSAGSAYLINHRVAQNGHWTVSAFGRASTRTPEAVDRAIAEVGPLPAMDVPKVAAVRYAADAAIRMGLGDDGPDVLVAWMPEPDTSYHYRELGSDATRAAMAACDAAFADILEAARSGPRGARTAVIAMSDHGHITTTALWSIEDALRADGIKAAKEPGEGDTVALTNGRCGEFRPLSDDPGLVRDLAAWATARPEIGMLFARDPDAAPGALPLSAVGLDHDRAPPLMWVAVDEQAEDRWGFQGRGVFTGGVPVGGGMHGGLHARELNTTLIVSAPEGGRGLHDPRPCGLIDIAPTTLALLGVEADGCDGAALPLDGAPAAAQTQTLEAGVGDFRQRLTLRMLDGRRYLGEGGRA